MNNREKCWLQDFLCQKVLSPYIWLSAGDVMLCLEAYGGRFEDVTHGTVKVTLNRLFKRGIIVRKGKGHRGNPYLYRVKA